MYNIKVKYGIFNNDMYNFDKTGFLMGIITTRMVVTTSNGYRKAKKVQPNNRK